MIPPPDPHRAGARARAGAGGDEHQGGFYKVGCCPPGRCASNRFAAKCAPEDGWRSRRGAPCSSLVVTQPSPPGPCGYDPEPLPNGNRRASPPSRDDAVLMARIPRAAKADWTGGSGIILGEPRPCLAAEFRKRIPPLSRWLPRYGRGRRKRAAGQDRPGRLRRAMVPGRAAAAPEVL